MTANDLIQFLQCIFWICIWGNVNSSNKNTGEFSQIVWLTSWHLNLGSLSINFDYIWVLCSFYLSSTIAWSGMLWWGQVSVKMWAQQSLIPTSLSLISCILFSCDWTLARSWLGSGIALGSVWVSLTLIPALFPLFLGWSHCQWWRMPLLFHLTLMSVFWS